MDGRSISVISTLSSPTSKILQPLLAFLFLSVASILGEGSKYKYISNLSIMQMYLFFYKGDLWLESGDCGASHLLPDLTPAECNPASNVCKSSASFFIPPHDPPFTHSYIHTHQKEFHQAANHGCCSRKSCF